MASAVLFGGYFWGSQEMGWRAALPETKIASASSRQISPADEQIHSSGPSSVKRWPRKEGACEPVTNSDYDIDRHGRNPVRSGQSYGQTVCWMAEIFTAEGPPLVSWEKGIYCRMHYRKLFMESAVRVGSFLYSGMVTLRATA